MNAFAALQDSSDSDSDVEDIAIPESVPANTKNNANITKANASQALVNSANSIAVIGDSNNRKRSRDVRQSGGVIPVRYDMVVGLLPQHNEDDGT